MKKNVTRKDIAKEAGVSVSVVSRALNNSGYVEKEKKKRILEIAKRAEYVPNPMAMALQQKRTRQLLFFCGDLTGTYYNQQNMFQIPWQWPYNRKEPDSCCSSVGILQEPIITRCIMAWPERQKKEDTTF